jgi:hypothetical protein
MTGAGRREGFAVATAVFALVVVGALAMGTLFAATTELRGGSDAVHQARAIMAAELGLEQPIASWSREWNGAFARGYGRQWMFSTPEGARVTGSLTRLADDLYLITSDAQAGPARRQVARVVRLDVADPQLAAALTASGPMSVSPGIDGADHIPPQWDCAAPGPPIPPLTIADTTTVLTFGHFDWGVLPALANSRVSLRVTGAEPRGSDEECDTTHPLNWGEPHKWNGGSCASYYPLIYAAGDLVVDGGRGEGMLVVDGNLTLQAGFEFFGVVLVRGTLFGGPGGARITGAVLLAQQRDSASTLDGIAIDFSRCAARKAFLELARPVPVTERSWSERFDTP